jgi:hypothetical protein
MAQQHFFHLARVHVGAAGHDEVLAAILERQEPIRIERAQVAGPEPSVT